MQEATKIPQAHASVICFDLIAEFWHLPLADRPISSPTFAKLQPSPRNFLTGHIFDTKPTQLFNFFLSTLLRRCHLHIQHELIQKGCARAWKGPRARERLCLLPLYELTVYVAEEARRWSWLLTIWTWDVGGRSSRRNSTPTWLDGPGEPLRHIFVNTGKLVARVAPVIPGGTGTMKVFAFSFRNSDKIFEDVWVGFRRNIWSILDAVFYWKGQISQYFLIHRCKSGSERLCKKRHIWNISEIHSLLQVLWYDTSHSNHFRNKTR